MFDLYSYAKYILKIGGTVKHVVTMEDCWADYQDEINSCVQSFARLTIEQINTFRVNINVEDIEDDEKIMFNTTNLTKIQPTPINSKPLKDKTKSLEMLVTKIIKRTGKWVECTC